MTHEHDPLEGPECWYETPGDVTYPEERVTSPTGGQKGQKVARYDLIPPEALDAVAQVYGMGARKYEDNNWRKGYAWSLSFAALMRHAWAFWRGETYDRESGLHHMAHAVFHALALIQNTTDYPNYDDRWTHDG
jgi:hypothetical protein